jgi:hypothetical protein
MSLHVMSPSSEGNRFNPRPTTSFLGGRGFGVRYPSPFFDVAQQFLPENVHQLHQWCRYYFLTNPIINVACQKMAEYPVTPIIWETDDDKLRKLYTDLELQLGLQQFQVEVGLDYFVYGNAFVSVMFQLEKWLVCSKCDARYRASKNRSLYRWRGGRFVLHCPKCQHQGVARQADVYLRNARGARLIRWNPENIEVKYNEITGVSRYYYRLPLRVINDIKLGDPDTVESLPYQFLDAARRGRALIFNSDNFYHLKRPTIAQKDQGWGTPLIYPLLKDAFYLQVMKKAQESLLLEHVVPLRIIFPGPSTGGNEQPFGSYNLQNWKRKIDSELNIWKRDHNYIPILPVNVGFQQVGGTAKALILHHEFRVHAEHMLAGAGIPVEFVFGGLQWSSSNTSLRALENTFLGYNRQRFGLTQFVIRKIASHMGWPWADFRFDRFKMADDLQRSMFYFQLNQAQKVSDRRLLDELGEDFDRETERMGEELKKQLDTQRTMQIASADVQGAAQLRQSHYQAKAQALIQKAQLDAQMESQMEAQAMGMQAPGQEGAQPGQEGQQPGAPSQQGAGGQQGGDQAQQVQGMPEGATAYDENAQDPNAAKAPTAMGGLASPLQAGQGPGIDLRYIAQRAASYLRMVRQESGSQAMYQEMERMQTENPNLYRLVVQLMDDSGSQQNPMNPMTSPVTGSGQRDPSRVVG